MDVHLAIIGHRSSQPVAGPGGAPVNLIDTGLSTSEDDPAGAWLFEAIDDARREMRVRQRQIPGDATTPLRLGIVVTAEGGTALDIHTGSANLRSLDPATAADRETVLQDLRTLEQTFLSGH